MNAVIVRKDGTFEVQNVDPNPLLYVDGVRYRLVQFVPPEFTAVRRTLPVFSEIASGAPDEGE